MTTTATIRRTVKARDIPAAWREGLPVDPDALVEVAITPLARRGGASPRRFLGAGRGLFGSAAAVDAYIRQGRDAWRT